MVSAALHSQSIRLFWSRARKFLGRRAALYSVKETCTRKNLYKEQETAVVVHVSGASQLVQDSFSSFSTVCHQH